MIKKNSFCAGRWINTKTGKSVFVFRGSNRVTGAEIAWLKVTGQKSMRFTGKNIAKLEALILDAVNDKELVAA